MEQIIQRLPLESEAVLHDVVVQYRTWGTLNETRDNVLLVCHALTGNADVDDWWGGLLGPGRALDTDQYFVICMNVLGSCYGTTGPSSIQPGTNRPYGGAFPVVTVRDAVTLQKAVLDALSINGLAAVIGGSMGGMLVLEWAFMGDFVRALVPIGCGGYHSAWSIGWGEAQRQAIYADPLWHDGFYRPEAPPAAGLAAARMMAMVSYRSAPSFQRRFARKQKAENEPYAVASYLQYQGQKLVGRFDANSYVRLTQLMDSHDLARGRGGYPDVLRCITQPTLVIGIDSDVLYPLEEQAELVRHIPSATLEVINSEDGHDAFLIEFEQLNRYVIPWLNAQITRSLVA